MTSYPYSEISRRYCRENTLLTLPVMFYSVFLVFVILEIFFSQEVPLIAGNFIAVGNGSILEEIDDETVCWTYRRANDSFLGYLEMITDFTSLEFSAMSDNKISLVTLVANTDSLGFYHISSVESSFQDIKLLPGDFKDMDERLDTTKVRRIPFFVDLQNFVNPDGSMNRICFRTNLTITYDNMKIEKRDIYLSNEILVISDSTKITGNIVAKANSQIIVNCTRFELTGDIFLEESKFEMNDGGWIFHETYNHEHVIFANSSTIDWKVGSFFIYEPYSLDIMSSSVQMSNIDFVGGSYTAVLDATSSLILNNVAKLGEILVPAQSKLQIENSNSVLVWLRFNSLIEGSFKVPKADEDFDTKKIPGLQQHDVLISNSTNVKYGIILDTEGYITVKDSKLVAVGMTFGSGQNFVNDVKDGETYQDKVIYGSKSQGIHLLDSTVNAWNFYAMSFFGEVNLEIQDSVFGESIAYGQGNISVTSSTCDGKGGYLGAQGSATMNVVKSTITTKVISKDDSKMYFLDSIIQGDVYVENGLIVLDNCKLQGQKIVTGNGSVIVK